MVSALDFGSNGPGSTPGRGTVLCSWARYFTLIVRLSTQVYKWVPANLRRSRCRRSLLKLPSFDSKRSVFAFYYTKDCQRNFWL